MRLVVLCVLVVLAAPASARAGGAVTAFYYPWYGTPAADGAWQHWSQRDHHPPATIASNYWPARGLYSSSSRAVIRAQMTEIAGAGITGIAVSWWGRGSPEAARLPAVAAAARARGLEVDVHLEPYAGRTVAGTAADIAYLRRLGITTFYLYQPFDRPAADWAALNDALPHGVRVFAQTGFVGQAAAGHFAGVYTYDVLVYGADFLHRYCREAHAKGLLCAPSVGPGYDARSGSGDDRVKPRRNGAAYDAMWRAAIAARPDLVTITSFNEWHEGTQIEPVARRRGYDSYEGAWGLHGTQAQTAYLRRTAYWSARYRGSTTASAEQPNTSASSTSASSTPRRHG